MKSRDGTLERVVNRRTNGGLQSVKMSAGQTIAKDPERHRTVVTKSLYPGLPKKRSQSDLLWTSVGVIVTYRPGDLRAYYDGPPYTKSHRLLGDERSGEEDGKRTVGSGEGWRGAEKDFLVGCARTGAKHADKDSRAFHTIVLV